MGLPPIACYSRYHYDNTVMRLLLVMGCTYDSNTAGHWLHKWTVPGHCNIQYRTWVRRDGLVQLSAKLHEYYWNVEAKERLGLPLPPKWISSITTTR